MTALLLFIISVSASTYSQYWQKNAANAMQMNAQASAISKLLSKPMLLSVFFLGLAALTWLAVLSYWPVSSAYPLLSINFVIMLLISHFIFHEPITKQQIVGVCLIMFGVVCMTGDKFWLTH